MDITSQGVQKILDGNKDKSDQPVARLFEALRDALLRAETAEAKLAKVRDVLNMTRKLTPEVSAICDDLARALNGDG